MSGFGGGVASLSMKTASGGAAPTPTMYYDFGNSSSWNGGTTINDLSGNGYNTTLSSTTGLSSSGVGGVQCLSCSTNPCLGNRGTYTTPSNLGNNIGTGDFALEFWWNPYLIPHQANYYYSINNMNFYKRSGNNGITLRWGEQCLLWMDNVNTNAYWSTPGPPTFPTFHTGIVNAAPAHTANAPYPATPTSYSYTGGQRFSTASPYNGYHGWEHAIFSRVSGTLTNYLNGVATATYTNASISYPSFGGATVLGSGIYNFPSQPHNCGYNSWYMGGLRMHKFYNYGLTAAQALASFDADKAIFGL